jgi:hypothetical protein
VNVTVVNTHNQSPVSNFGVLLPLTAAFPTAAKGTVGLYAEDRHDGWIQIQALDRMFTPKIPGWSLEPTHDRFGSGASLSSSRFALTCLDFAFGPFCSG